jgi:hypothetical protein
MVGGISKPGSGGKSVVSQMFFKTVVVCIYCVLLATCSQDGVPEHNKEVKMTEVKIASKEQIESMKIDYNAQDVQKINGVLTFASALLANKISVDSAQAIEQLGKGSYSVPKSPDGEITYITYDSQIELSFGLNGGAYGGIYKGYLYSFDRLSTKSPWQKFHLNVSYPYDYTVNIPITHSFIEALGLVLVKTVPDQPCDNINGKCNAFMYRSRLHPKLGYIFLTDQDRSDLKSGLPTNFRSVEIRVIQP